MQLTLYTDYALRTLIYLAAHEGSTTVAEVAEAFGISRNHLVKVVHNLGKQGYIHTTKGRSGGIVLARDPAMISVRDVVRDMEPTMDLFECFGEQSQCPITPACRLKGVMMKARKAFFDVLGEYTVADVAANADELRALLYTKESISRQT
jgi:Rrf2 family nitric oxide-sensitive transcriptional repressor